MARHNREARGQDQHGRSYEVSYQPDWLHQIKVTRALANGRQSTRLLFRNPAPAEQAPGPRVRTRLSAAEPPLDVTLEVEDPQGVITRIIVETRAPGASEAEAVSFSIEARGARAGGIRHGVPQKM